MKEFWNERYSKTEYAYGKNPNNFLKEQITSLKPGKILFPAEGEGRNAVFAASLGWEVYAFDFSEEAKQKARTLAREKNQTLKYDVLDIAQMDFMPESFDCIALIYCHLPKHLKATIYGKFSSYLKPGGRIIFEAFSKEHPSFQLKNPNVGGPKDPEMLFSIEDIKAYFHLLKTIELENETIELNEGDGHTGEGNVVRYIGEKL